MTAISRYTEEQFSEILKAWFDYEEPVVDKRRAVFSPFDIEPYAEVTVTSLLRIEFQEYIMLERGYKRVLEERGSDYFDYLTDRERKGGSFKLIGFSKLKEDWKAELLPEHPIIHILEVAFEQVPLYINSPVNEIAKIARLRLMFGK